MLELEPALEKNKRMRFNLFMDLVTTESNYVGILKTIVTVRISVMCEHLADAGREHCVHSKPIFVHFVSHLFDSCSTSH